MADTDNTVNLKVDVSANTDGAIKALDEVKSEAGATTATTETLCAVLNKVVSGLGDAVKAKNVSLGILSVVGAAYNADKERLDAWDKSMTEAGKRAARPDLLEAIHARIKAMNEAIAAAQAYSDRLKEIADAEPGILAQLKEQLSLNSAVAAARHDQMNADKTQALAKVDEREATGEITPSQAIEQKADIERKALTEQESEKQKQRAQASSAEAAALKEGREKAPGLHEAEETARKRLDDDEIHRAGLRDVTKQIGEAVERVDKAIETLAPLQKISDDFNYDVTGRKEFDREKLTPAKDELEKAQAEVVLFRKEQGQYLASQTKEATDKLQVEKDSLIQAQNAETGNTQDIHDIEQAVKNTKAKEKAAAPAEQAAVQSRQAAITDEENAALDKQIKADLDQARKLRDHGNRTGLLAMLQDIKNALSGNVEVVNYAKTLGVTTDDLQQQILQLKSQITAARSGNTN